MPDEKTSLRPDARRVGPPVLLGLRARFIERAVTIALLDERIRALILWGSIARGDADEWSDVDLVVSVTDAAIPDLLEELSQEESAYGESLVTLSLPQNGVEGGGFLSVTYLRSALPLHVDWYLCPESLGLADLDTKPLFSRDGWPTSGTSFAEILHDRPSRESSSPPEADLLASRIPLLVKEVARGRPEAVLVDGEPVHDRIAAYEALTRDIAALPPEYRDKRPPLYNHLGIARQLAR